jgi:hypothetical protein
LESVVIASQPTSLDVPPIVVFLQQVWKTIMLSALIVMSPQMGNLQHIAALFALV